MTQEPVESWTAQSVIDAEFHHKSPEQIAEYLNLVAYSQKQKLIEEIEGIIKTARDKKYKCQHTVPTITVRQDGTQYSCEDIHIGRQEFASDILEDIKRCKS